MGGRPGRTLVSLSCGEADGGEVEAGDAVEVAGVGGGDFPAGGDGGGGDDPVVNADVGSGGG
jgi:hypothetical protein